MKGAISKTGYKSNSKDKENDFNIIPSSFITMKNVKFPVRGIDDLGNDKLMKPGLDYNFPGSHVIEFPIKKKGGISPEKAKEILHDGTAHGVKLTDKQRKYFGYMSNKKQGGELPLDILTARLKAQGYTGNALHEKLEEIRSSMGGSTFVKPTMRLGGGLSPENAKNILKSGKVYGTDITDAQRKHFAQIAGTDEEGNELDEHGNPIEEGEYEEVNDTGESDVEEGEEMRYGGLTKYQTRGEVKFDPMTGIHVAQSPSEKQFTPQQYDERMKGYTKDPTWKAGATPTSKYAGYLPKGYTFAPDSTTGSGFRFSDPSGKTLEYEGVAPSINYQYQPFKQPFVPGKEQKVFPDPNIERQRQVQESFRYKQYGGTGKKPLFNPSVEPGMMAPDKALELYTKKYGAPEKTYGVNRNVEAGATMGPRAFGIEDPLWNPAGAFKTQQPQFQQALSGETTQQFIQRMQQGFKQEGGSNSPLGYGQFPVLNFGGNPFTKPTLAKFINGYMKKQFGGSSAAQGDTMNDHLEQRKNTFHNFLASNNMSHMMNEELGKLMYGGTESSDNQFMQYGGVGGFPIFDVGGQGDKEKGQGDMYADAQKRISDQMKLNESNPGGFNNPQPVDWTPKWQTPSNITNPNPAQNITMDPNQTAGMPTVAQNPTFPKKQPSKFQQAWQKNKPYLADEAIAGTNFLAGMFEGTDNQRRKKALEAKMSADNVFAPLSGNASSRGDYEANTGAFRPNQYTPAQNTGAYRGGGEHKVGDVVEMSYSDLTRFLQMGGTVEWVD